jgi:kinesin family protein C1
MESNFSALEAPRMNMQEHTPPISYALPTRRNPSDAGLQEFTPVRLGQQSKVPILTPSKPIQPPSVSPQRKSKRAPNPSFLSKESTVTNFNRALDTEWDQEMKEKNMEEIMARVFSRVNQSGQESQGLKEAVEVYKARS